MDNKAIARLYKEKEQLLQKALQLRDELKERENDGRRHKINLNFTLSSDDETNEPPESQFTKGEVKLCEISSQVMGITFEDVDKKWQRDDIYVYTAKVVTKTISFNLELIVHLKDPNDFKIENIACHLKDDSCAHEVSPWFQEIMDTNNFSLLMSAISDFNDYSILRSEILRSLEASGYGKVEQCTEGNGGILVYVSSPSNTENYYVTFHWRIKFLLSTWHIEHFFTVKSTDIGIGFSEGNRSLLKEFCRVGLTKDSLIDLWNALYVAIDNYDAKDMEHL